MIRRRVCERLVAFLFLGATAQGQQVGVACRLHRRRGDPLRFQREGRLELTTAPRSQTVATGIPEGFRSLKPKRVAPGGAEAGGSHLLIVLEGRLEAMLVCFGFR
jgi:hypothetical protein